MGRFSLKWLLVGVAVIGLAMACLLNASLTLNAILRSLYGLSLIAAAICAVYRRNVFCGGVAIAGLLHSVLTSNFGAQRSFSDEVINQLATDWVRLGNDKHSQAVWAMLNTFRDMIVSFLGGIVACVVATKARP
jgi:hypothetical protein